MSAPSPIAASSPALLLPRAEWQAQAAAHLERADALIGDYPQRRSRGETHPVWDFLFTYYSYKPGLIRRWHPGVGAVLADAADAPNAAWRWYRVSADASTASGATAAPSVTFDATAFMADRGDGVDAIEDLLRQTQSRAGRFDCFGLHEWAMVYRADEHRHEVPLRLGQAGTDAVVEAHELRCTHFDAFRFFTPPATPRNLLPLTRINQRDTEQCGCLHAGMDLYKWAMKLAPAVPGSLVLDAFELARDIRRLDMEASPYDLAAWGFQPVMIETTDGKAEYVRRQRALSARGEAIRSALLDVIERTRMAARA